MRITKELLATVKTKRTNCRRPGWNAFEIGISEKSSEYHHKEPADDVDFFSFTVEQYGGVLIILHYKEKL